MTDEVSQPTEPLSSGWTHGAHEKVDRYLDEVFAVLGALGYTKWLHDMVVVVWDPPAIQIRLHGKLPEELADTVHRASREGIAVEHVYLTGDPEKLEAAMIRLADALHAHHIDWSTMSPDAMYTKLTVGVPEAALTEAEADQIRCIASETLDNIPIDIVQREHVQLL